MNAAPDVVQFAADLGGDGAEAALQRAVSHRDARLLERWVEASSRGGISQRRTLSGLRSQFAAPGARDFLLHMIFRFR